MAKRKSLSDLLNDITFKSLYDKYKLIAMNAYEWEGLPEGITSRHIERELFHRGQAIFFRDPQMSWMCLQAAETGKVNVYGDPLEYRAVGVGYDKLFKADDVVIVRNNMLKLATEPFIMFYVNKLTEAERTMDVNVKAAKTPIIFACDDKNVLSFKALFNQVDGNVPAIYADKNLNLDSISAFDTKVKFLGNELMTYKKSIENDLLTFLGENNANTDKRERMITDEANANNQIIESFAELGLTARREDAKLMSEISGYNITVRRRDREEFSTFEDVENVEKGDDDNVE